MIRITVFSGPGLHGLHQRRGQRWDAWCKEALGNSEAHLRQISCVSENFRGATTDISKLPTQTDSLYALARLKRDAPEAFEQAIQEKGRRREWPRPRRTIHRRGRYVAAGGQFQGQRHQQGSAASP